MTILNVLLYPNAMLKQKATEIFEITPQIKKLANDMLETMYNAKGIGLAATQVGELKRIIVIDIQNQDENHIYVMINPKIIEHCENKIDSEEGCLSIPKQTETIKRYEHITVTYMDLDGKMNTLVASDLLGICIQHEIDHLDGKLFIDHLSPLKRKMLIRRYNKEQQQVD